jgi:hypothetical protein
VGIPYLLRDFQTEWKSCCYISIQRLFDSLFLCQLSGQIRPASGIPDFCAASDGHTLSFTTPNCSTSSSIRQVRTLTKTIQMWAIADNVFISAHRGTREFSIANLQRLPDCHFHPKGVKYPRSRLRCKAI